MVVQSKSVQYDSSQPRDRLPTLTEGVFDSAEFSFPSHPLGVRISMSKPGSSNTGTDRCHSLIHLRKRLTQPLAPTVPYGEVRLLCWGRIVSYSYGFQGWYWTGLRLSRSSSRKHCT